MLRWLDWLWPPTRLEAGPAKWTRDRMGWLVGQFGWDRFLNCPVVLPTPTYFPDPFDKSEVAARRLFERTCGYMHIDPAGVELQFYYPVHRPGFTGSVVREALNWTGQYQSDAGKKIVRIDGALLPDPETLVATFAHELAHVVLLGEQRIAADDPDHELVTDLTTVFFGMGVFNANMAYREKFVENERGQSIQQLGYLTPPIWSYALAVFASLRDEPRPEWVRYLRTAVRSPCQRAIAELSGRNRPHLVVGGKLDSDTRAALLYPQYPWLGRIAPAADADPPQADPEAHNSAAAVDDDDSAVADSPDGHFDPDCTADDLFALGLAYSNQRDWPSAVFAFSAAIQKSPQDGEAFQKRAWAHFEQGQFQHAIDDGAAAVHFSPDDSDSFLARGAAALQIGDFDLAIADLTHYVRAESGCRSDGTRPSRGCYFRGLAHSARRDWTRAVADFSEAICFFADWPEPYEGRAAAYDQLGESAKAAADRAAAQRRAGGKPVV